MCEVETGPPVNVKRQRLGEDETSFRCSDSGQACTDVCWWCDFDEAKQADCGCLPKPVVGKVSARLLKAWLFRNNEDQVVSEVYNRIYAASEVTARDLLLPVNVKKGCVRKGVYAR